ncbi:hypothetical protein HK099_004055 [Clydaea vesicula]|uniref:Uncharacterized protein n=1 Tax=Clydaea vesicula TaxID=447962 RepID=A0AAD5Y0H9_9FUNG|nr:hypothetical protein HK099_004055 [Clydaea vesicula]
MNQYQKLKKSKSIVTLKNAINNTWEKRTSISVEIAPLIENLKGSRRISSGTCKRKTTIDGKDCYIITPVATESPEIPPLFQENIPLALINEIPEVLFRSHILELNKLLIEAHCTRAKYYSVLKICCLILLTLLVFIMFCLMLSSRLNLAFFFFLIILSVVICWPLFTKYWFTSFLGNVQKQIQNSVVEWNYRAPQNVSFRILTAGNFYRHGEHFGVDELSADLTTNAQKYESFILEFLKANKKIKPRGVSLQAIRRAYMNEAQANDEIKLLVKEGKVIDHDYNKFSIASPNNRFSRRFNQTPTIDYSKEVPDHQPYCTSSGRKSCTPLKFGRIVAPTTSRKYQRKLSETPSSIGNLSQEINQLRRERNISNLRIRDLESTENELREKIEELKRNFDEKHRECRELLKEIQDLKKERKELRDNIFVKENELKRLLQAANASTITQESSTICINESVIYDFDESAVMLNHSNEDTEITEIQDAIQEHFGDSDGESSVGNICATNAADSPMNINDLVNETTELHNVLNVEPVNGFINEVDSNNSEISLLKERILKLKNDLSGKEALITDRANQIQEMESAAEKQTTYMEQLQRNSDEKISKLIEEMELIKIQMNMEKKMYLDQIEELNQKFIASEDEKFKTERVLREKSATLSNYQQELASALDKFEKLDEKFKKLTFENNMLQQKLNAKSVELENEISKFNFQLSEMETRLGIEFSEKTADYLKTTEEEKVNLINEHTQLTENLQKEVMDLRTKLAEELSLYNEKVKTIEGSKEILKTKYEKELHLCKSEYESLNLHFEETLTLKSQVIAKLTEEKAGLEQNKLHLLQEIQSKYENLIKEKEEAEIKIKEVEMRVKATLNNQFTEIKLKFENTLISINEEFASDYSSFGCNQMLNSEYFLLHEE